RPGHPGRGQDRDLVSHRRHPAQAGGRVPGDAAQAVAVSGPVLCSCRRPPRGGRGVMRAAWGALLGLALAGSAEGAVAGRVTDGDGRPLPGATVTAYGPESTDERLLRVVRGRARTPLASTRSGADGAFRFDALA